LKVLGLVSATKVIGTENVKEVKNKLLAPLPTVATIRQLGQLDFSVQIMGLGHISKTELTCKK